jgi:hypothetical protein
MQLVLLTFAFFFGLRMIRQVALQIAQENHDALAAMDQAAEEERKKRETRADAEASAAYAKVKPILSKPPSAPTSKGSGMV